MGSCSICKPKTSVAICACCRHLVSDSLGVGQETSVWQSQRDLTVSELWGAWSSWKGVQIPALWGPLASSWEDEQVSQGLACGSPYPCPESQPPASSGGVGVPHKAVSAGYSSLVPKLPSSLQSHIRRVMIIPVTHLFPLFSHCPLFLTLLFPYPFSLPHCVSFPFKPFIFDHDPP